MEVKRMVENAAAEGIDLAELGKKFAARWLKLIYDSCSDEEANDIISGVIEEPWSDDGVWGAMDTFYDEMDELGLEDEEIETVEEEFLKALKKMVAKPFSH